MRPARYCPRETPTEDIIDNLAYVMQSMSENEGACTRGIGFLAYMNGWKYEHFSMRYCSAFMAMLQQPVPARVKLFLVVNPPGWFPAIWKIMKRMLSHEFRKKVFMIKEEALDDYLEEGFEDYLPDDMARGKANSKELVKDFIAYRKFVEDAIGIDL
jgi:CRAL/TRIO domain